MINLFIDTNVLLNFYSFSKDHLSKLEEIISLIKKKEIKVIIPNQLIDEFERNRETKLKLSMEHLDKFVPKLNIPVFCRELSEIKEIKSRINEIEKLSSDLLVKLNKEIKNNSLQADKLVQEIFSISEILVVDKELLNIAKDRFDRGNPPGKNGSYGDAINWECILKYVSPKTDLYFVGGDKDFKSLLNDSEFSPFLLKEWHEKKNSELYYYELISSFLQDKFKQINITDEQVKEEKQVISSEPQLPSRSVAFGTSGYSSSFDIVGSGVHSFTVIDYHCNNCGADYQDTKETYGIFFNNYFNSGGFKICPRCGYPNLPKSNK